MKELVELLKTHFGTAIITVVFGGILITGMIRGSIGSFKFGKDGIYFEGRKAKILKLSNLNNILDNQIIKLDCEMIDVVILQSDKLRRNLLHFLNSFIKHPTAKRVIASAIRQPLYNAARRNRFHEVLRPSNTKEYMNKLMDEIKLEYADINIEQADFQCPIHGGSCIEYPAWEVYKEELRNLLIKEWIIPVREYRIKTSLKKIALYDQYITTYKELGDETRVAITQQCINKNKGYIDTLKEKEYE
jgi:hypothetical protein